MSCISSQAESKAVVQELLQQLATGALCLVTLAVLAIAVDYAGIASLLRDQPQYGFIALVGAGLSFAPLVVCVAVASVQRGEQQTNLPDLYE